MCAHTSVVLLIVGMYFRRKDGSLEFIFAEEGLFEISENKNLKLPAIR